MANPPIVPPTPSAPKVEVPPKRPRRKRVRFAKPLVSKYYSRLSQYRNLRSLKTDMPTKSCLKKVSHYQDDSYVEPKHHRKPRGHHRSRNCRRPSPRRRSIACKSRHGTYRRARRAKCCSRHSSCSTRVVKTRRSKSRCKSSARSKTYRITRSMKRKISSRAKSVVKAKKRKISKSKSCKQNSRSQSRNHKREKNKKKLKKENQNDKRTKHIKERHARKKSAMRTRRDPQKPPEDEDVDAKLYREFKESVAKRPAAKKSR